MGQELTGMKPNNTYTWLIHLGGPGPLTEAPRTLTLGDGTELPLAVSSVHGLLAAGGLFYVGNPLTDAITCCVTGAQIGFVDNTTPGDPRWAAFNFDNLPGQVEFSPPTISGTLAVVSQIPTTPAAIGAAAASHTHPAAEISDSTAAGRALLTATDVAAQRAALGSDRRYRRVKTGHYVEMAPAHSGMTGYYTGGAGAAATSSNSFSLSTNAAANATAVLANTSFNGYWFARPGVDWGEGIVWTRPFVLTFRVGTTVPTANTTAYYKLGEDRTNTTFGPLTKIGVGIKCEGLSYKAMVHNGTNVFIGSVVLATAASGHVHDFEIVNLGNGSVEFWANGVLKETMYNGPASAGSGHCAFQIHLTNGATAAITYCGVYGPYTIQFLD